MSVVEHLGVADMEQGLAEARQLWQDWVAQDPAVWVVVRALLPGAIGVARRASENPETDALVATQLWLGVREFPWWRHRKVAGNVLANIRSHLGRAGEPRLSSIERRIVPVARVPDRVQEEDVSSRQE